MSQAKDQGKRVRRRAKKFRSQIIAAWLIENYAPCKVADIGGGKGLLTYILNKNGWNATVIDPEYQELPPKYTDLNKQRVKINLEESVPHITEKFQKEMAKDFDLLIGLHTHGSNMLTLDAAKEFKKDFLLLPCCVIDEPVEKKPDINWKDSLIEYAKEMGLDVKTVQYGFMGKDIGLYTDNNLQKK